MLKNQACAGPYLSAGRSHRGEINPPDGIKHATGRADGWAQHMVVAPMDSALEQKSPQCGCGSVLLRFAVCLYPAPRPGWGAGSCRPLNHRLAAAKPRTQG